MNDFVKLNLPGTEPTTVYIKISRIIWVRDTGMESRSHKACCRVCYAALPNDGGFDALNVVGTADKVIEKIRKRILANRDAGL